MSEIHLSPTEAATKLGITTKALKLYECHGLVSPLRAANGYRTYGPAEMARLHQVLALKRLGLPLAKIAGLLRGSLASLDAILALQEDLLGREADRLSHALTLVRAARARLAAGDRLSVDDLANLTTETTMTKPKPDDLKATMDRIVNRHFTAEDRAELAKISFDQDAVTQAWTALIADAKALMAKNDTASPAALDLARRWHAQISAFTLNKPDIETKLKAVWADALVDPEAAPTLPINAELMAFMGRVTANLKPAGPA